MTPLVLVVTVCSIADPDLCLTREQRFGSATGRPGACERYARAAVPNIFVESPGFITRYRCRRDDIPEIDS